MTASRIRLIAASTLAALAVSASAGAAQSDSTWRDHEQALQAARAAHDTTAYRAQLGAVHRVIGATPRIAARFAGLALGAHDRAAAARWLGALATMGVALDSSMLVQYAALAGARARNTLLARHARATSDVGEPALAFALPDPSMIPEDIVYDAGHSQMLVSSVHTGGIFARPVPGAGPASGKFNIDSSWGIFALGIDSARGVLWATTAALPMAAHYTASDSGRSALLALDPVTGAVRGRYSAPDSGAHVLGDLVVAYSGAVYVSDGLGSGVYVLDSGSDALRTLVPPGVFTSPQTPALSSDGARLLVPDYSIGIAAVSIATGAVRWIAHSDSLALTGIDGMYRIGHDIIAVQNGVEPNRIVRLTLDPQLRRVLRAPTIVRGSKVHDLNHATISHGWLYFIRRSGWARVGDDGSIADAPTGAGPEVVRVRITP